MPHTVVSTVVPERVHLPGVPLTKDNSHQAQGQKRFWSATPGNAGLVGHQGAAVLRFQSAKQGAGHDTRKR